MTTTRDELIQLERAGWDALSSSGDAAGAYYDATLAPDVLMLLPGGLVIDDRDAAIESMRGEPWSSHELSDLRVIELGDDVAVLAYRAHATRAGVEYRALVNSTFVRDDGGWKLVVHQQTPA